MRVPLSPIRDAVVRHASPTARSSSARELFPELGSNLKRAGVLDRCVWREGRGHFLLEKEEIIDHRHAYASSHMAEN